MRTIITLLFLTAGAAAQTPVIAAFGDSLSAGYRLQPGEGFAPALQRTLAKQGINAKVVNAAISGETSGEGLLRVDFMLKKYQPDMVIVEFGANDMLRGHPPETVYDNLDAILAQIHAAGAKVLLAGMEATPNLGVAYGIEFKLVYRRLAFKHGVELFPFFLQDVALVPRLNLDDGIHPNAIGVQVIADNIAPLVIEVLND